MSAPANLSIFSELPPRRRISAGYIFTMILLSPVIIPVGLLMLLLCGLSAIWGGILVVRRKYLDYRLDATMRSAGRYLTWQEFTSKLDEGKGTLIVDFEIAGWPGRLSRIWWTPEDVYSLCPFPWVDLEAEMEDPDFKRAPDWCRGRYTGNNGTAILVGANKAQLRSLYESVDLFRSIPRHRMNWVDVCPFWRPPTPPARRRSILGLSVPVHKAIHNPGR